MAKAIGGHSGPKSAMAMAIAAIPVAPPLIAGLYIPFLQQFHHEYTAVRPVIHVVL